MRVAKFSPVVEARLVPVDPPPDRKSGARYLICSVTRSGKLVPDRWARTLPREESSQVAVEFPSLPPKSLVSIPNRERVGLALPQGRHTGRALMRNPVGIALVQRLKDADGALPDEVAFWVSLLAEMAWSYGPFGAVTCPPSSGKYARRTHLATDLAHGVSDRLGVPFQACFTDPDPRGHRASVHEKLREESRAYLFKPPDAWPLLVVDDAVTTGSTFDRCQDACSGEIRFATLSRH